MYLRKVLPWRTALLLWLFLDHELLKNQEHLRTYFLYVIWNKDHTSRGQSERGFSQCCTWTSRPPSGWHGLKKGVHSWPGLFSFWRPTGFIRNGASSPKGNPARREATKRPATSTFSGQQEKKELLGSGYHWDCGGWFQWWHSSEWPRLCDIQRHPRANRRYVGTFPSCLRQRQCGR